MGANLDESAALNQRHHRILETEPLVFELFRRRRRSYLLALANDDAHFSKWSRNDEPVPTFHPPATRIFHVDRHDWGSGFLCQKNNARTEFVGRTARAIGCN